MGEGSGNRPEPASPPVAAKGGQSEAKTDAGAGARERRGEGAERGTPPPAAAAAVAAAAAAAVAVVAVAVAVAAPPALLRCCPPLPFFFGLFGCPSPPANKKSAHSPSRRPGCP